MLWVLIRIIVEVVLLNTHIIGLTENEFKLSLDYHQIRTLSVFMNSIFQKLFGSGKDISPSYSSGVPETRTRGSRVL